MVYASSHISFREAFLLLLGCCFLLLGVHYYFGILGIVTVLCLGLLAAALPVLKLIKGSFLLVYFLASVLILDTREGIHLLEIPFFLLSSLLILNVYYLILIGSAKLENSLDNAFLLLHFLIPYAIILGVLNGAEIYKAISEIKYFLGIYTYFPLRKYFQFETFKKTLGVVLALVLIYVLLRNFYYYREIITQALLPWQAENARVAANELIIVLGCGITFSALALSKKKHILVITFPLFILFLGSLIITQSRGFWIATLISFCSIFFFTPLTGKKRIFNIFLFLLSISAIAIYLFDSDLLFLVLNALLERFQSIGSGTKENSLYDRWLESKTVFELITKNPIAGYGFGIEFTRKDIFYDIFIKTSYVHNGYLAILYKFGILGLISTIYIWLKSINMAVKMLPITKSEVVKIILLSIIGTITGMTIVNLTSPQFLYFEATLITTLFCAYLNTLQDKQNISGN